MKRVGSWAELALAKTSGTVIGDALSHVTVPEVFAKVNSVLLSNQWKKHAFKGQSNKKK